ENGCIADSVVPVVEAGQAVFVDDDYAIGEFLRFEPSRGHTPGHVSVRLRTAAGQAVFSGDLMHRTVQVAEPQWSSSFCYDRAEAAKTRREFVERHADSGTLILPAHFPHPGYIVRANGGHRFAAAEVGKATIWHLSTRCPRGQSLRCSGSCDRGWDFAAPPRTEAVLDAPEDLGLEQKRRAVRRSSALTV